MATDTDGDRPAESDSTLGTPSEESGPDSGGQVDSAPTEVEVEPWTFEDGATPPAYLDSSDEERAQLEAFDPFRRHMSLVEVTGMTVGTAEMRPSSPELFEMDVETSINDEFVDWDFLEKLKTWGGALKEPHEMTEEEYDSATALALKEKEPQFILRNLGRMEKHADPDKPIRLEAQEVLYGLGDTDARSHIKDLEFEKVEMIDAFGHDSVKERQRWMRWLTVGLKWPEYFAVELRGDRPGGVWKHAPNGPEDVARDHEAAQAEIERLDALRR